MAGQEKPPLFSFFCATYAANIVHHWNNLQVWGICSKNWCIFLGWGVEIWSKTSFQLWLIALGAEWGICGGECDAKQSVWCSSSAPAGARCSWDEGFRHNVVKPALKNYEETKTCVRLELVACFTISSVSLKVDACCLSNFLFFLSYLQVWIFHQCLTLYLKPKSGNWGSLSSGTTQILWNGSYINVCWVWMKSIVEKYLWSGTRFMVMMRWTGELTSAPCQREGKGYFLSMAGGSGGMWLLVWPQQVAQCCFCEFFITELHVVGWIWLNRMWKGDPHQQQWGAACCLRLSSLSLLVYLNLYVLDQSKRSCKELWPHSSSADPGYLLLFVPGLVPVSCLVFNM